MATGALARGDRVHGQFAYFAIVGAPLDVGAIVLGALMTIVVRRRRPAFRLAMAGTILFAVSLATWVSVVAPMNAILAQWTPGPIPDSFTAVRDRWEAGHIAISAIKTAGLCCTLAGGLSIGRPPATEADRRSAAPAAR